MTHDNRKKQPPPAAYIPRMIDDDTYVLPAYDAEAATIVQELAAHDDYGSLRVMG